jgi:hypothetical protein
VMEASSCRQSVLSILVYVVLGKTLLTLRMVVRNCSCSIACAACGAEANVLLAAIYLRAACAWKCNFFALNRRADASMMILPLGVSQPDTTSPSLSQIC